MTTCFCTGACKRFPYTCSGITPSTITISSFPGWESTACNESNKKSTKPVTNIFEFVAVDSKRRDDIRHVKNAMYELYSWILDNIQDNRERSIGIEKLEEAAMWLNKSISRRKDNGK